MNTIPRSPERGSGAHRSPLAAGAPGAVYALVLLLVLSGCSLMRLDRELEEAGGLGLVTGPVTTPGGSAENVVVALFRQTDQGPVFEQADRMTSVVRDYVFILEASTPRFTGEQAKAGMWTPLTAVRETGGVAVSSQLPRWAQEKARRIYGFDLDHEGILNDEEVARAYHRILDQTVERGAG